MTESLSQTVSDILDYLVTLQREQVRPRDAFVRLQGLRRNHSEFQIDLLSEEQTFDQSVHYDALLRLSGQGTFSLSYCPERAMPWPLRGVHRWNEGDLLRINGNVIAVDAAMACLDFIWDEVSIIERLINMGLVLEELSRNPIELTDDELQAAMNRFRAAKKLFKVEDTVRWLEQHGMSQEKLERYVAENAIVPKLRDRVTHGRIEDYFRQHEKDFDVVRIARLIVTDENKAYEYAKRLKSGEQEFFKVAAEINFDSIEHGMPAKESPFAILERHQVDSPLRDRLFTAKPGQLMGPVRTESGYALVYVAEIRPAVLDKRTRASIKDLLFRDWLAEQRQAAQIEWCWGNASKTA